MIWAGGVDSCMNFQKKVTHKFLCRSQVQFVDFNMEQHPYCFFDYLEVFNGPYASSPSAGRFCGPTAPAAFRSQTNSIRLVLFTDFSMSARGFRLRYSFTTEGEGSDISH